MVYSRQSLRLAVRIIFLILEAKIAFDFDPKTCLIEKSIASLVSVYIGIDLGTPLRYALHGGFAVLMILANILMNRFFVLSMKQNGAAKATVYNFAVNYVASLVFGYLFFNEIIS